MSEGMTTAQLMWITQARHNHSSVTNFHCIVQILRLSVRFKSAADLIFLIFFLLEFQLHQIIAEGSLMT